MEENQEGISLDDFDATISSGLLDEFTDDNLNLHSLTQRINNNIKQEGYQQYFLEVLEHGRISAATHNAHETLYAENSCCEETIVTIKKILRAIIPETPSLIGLCTASIIIAGISVKIYWTVAFEASARNDTERWINRLSSVFTNLVLGAYFLYQPFANDIRNNNIAPELQSSIMRLRITNFSGWTYRKMQLRNAAINTLKILASVPPSLIMAWVSYSDAGDSAFVATIIGLVNLGMNYAGTTGSVELLHAMLPMNWLRRKFICGSARNSFAYDIEVLRSALLDNLTAKNEFLLYMMQKNQHNVLNPLYEMMNQPLQSLPASNTLLLNIVHYPYRQQKRNPYIKGSIQIVGALGTILSTSGYFFSAVEGIENTFNFSRAGSIVTTVGLYIIPMALFLNVSRVIIGPIYDLCADFFSCRGIRHPLSFQQNKKSMIASMLTTLIITAFSSATTRALNEKYQDQIGIMRVPVEISTILFAWLFNWFPCSEVCSTFQANYQAVGNNENNVNQQNLLSFVSTAKSQFSQMSRHFFLRYLVELSDQFATSHNSSENPNQEQRENFFYLLFGHRTPTKVFSSFSNRNHPYCHTPSWRILIDTLLEQEIHAQRQRPCCSLFTQRNQSENTEHTRLIKGDKKFGLDF